MLANGGKTSTLTFVDAFYLPMGDPADPERHELQAAGVEGWIIASRGKTVVLVGPEFSKQFAFLNYSTHIAISADAEQHTDQANTALESIKQVSQAHSEGVLFVVIGGSLSKWLITEAFGSFASKDSFVDVGSALDGYAGIDNPNRLLVRVSEYCDMMKVWEPPDGLSRTWMAPLVAERVCNGTKAL